LLARVTTTAETVAWIDFEQPHRLARWRYQELGLFVFGRRQYEQAIETGGPNKLTLPHIVGS
jgi:hypothetical protein